MTDNQKRLIIEAADAYLSRHNFPAGNYDKLNQGQCMIIAQDAGGNIDIWEQVAFELSRDCWRKIKYDNRYLQNNRRPMPSKASAG